MQSSGSMKGSMVSLFSRGYSSLRLSMVPSLTVLTYHSIGPRSNDWSLTPMDVALFRRQMEHMKSKYRILGADQLYDVLKGGGKFPRRSAMITFDDGYRNNYTNAFPILKDLGIPAVMFLTSGYIESRELFWWDEIGYAMSRIFAATKKDEVIVNAGEGIACRPNGIPALIERLKEVPVEVRKKAVSGLRAEYSIDIPSSLVEENVLTWEEIREMSEHGVHFGGHTVDHPILAKLAPEEARRQILDSKEAIRKHVGKDVLSFAYPNGKLKDYSSDTMAYLREAGFEAAFTTIPKINARGTDPMQIGRIVAPYSMGRFKLLLSGFLGDIGRAH